MFPENLEALYELQTAVQEFTGSYVYIKGYNRCTVEKIQHMYMKTYRVRNQSSATYIYLHNHFIRPFYNETNYCRIHAVLPLNMINSWN
jgi:hypothetical protein